LTTTGSQASFAPHIQRTEVSEYAAKMEGASFQEMPVSKKKGGNFLTLFV